MTTAPKKSKYTFQTIVVPAEMRNEFTVVREDLMTSDKQLALAMWNIIMRDPGALAHEVAGLKEVAAQLKEITKISNGEAASAMPKAAKVKRVVAKKEPKPKKEKPAPKAKKEKKEKVTKTVMFEGKEEPEFFTGLEDDGDFQTIVVSGAGL